MIRPVASVAAMAPYALADLGAAGVTSLAQNESPFGTSPMAIAAGVKALKNAPLYPDPDWNDLRTAIAEMHGLAPQRILCGAGSMELIGALVRAYAGPGDTVLGTAHGYLFVATACQQAAAAYVKVPEPRMQVDVDALLAAVTPATRIVFLCNPGNPTGTRIDNARIMRLRAGLRDDVILAVDQAYGEFDDQPPGAVFALTECGNTVVLRTFSKAYALAGARVGWGVFPEEIATQMRKLLNPNNVAAVSQAMAAAAMRDPVHMHAIVAKTTAIRAEFAFALTKAGFVIRESHTNFVLIPFSDAATADEADKALRASGFLMRGMAGYGLPQCLRATVVAAEAMRKAARILAPFGKGTA
jgi:histidinol-phosphate aminotransferase